MTTLELTDYIKSQLNKNIPKYLIISRLIEVGWRMEDIEEGFSNIELKINETVSTLIDDIKLSEPKIVEAIMPSTETIKEIEDIVIQPIEIARPIEPQITETIVPNIETIKQEEPKKIWTPIIIEPKKEEIKQSSQIELYNLEIESLEKPVVSVAPAVEQEIPKKEVQNFEVLNIEIPKEETLEMELMPKISKVDKFVIEDLDLQKDSKAILDPYMKEFPKVSINPKDSMSDVVSRNAMISSYTQDILSANTKEEKPKLILKKKSFIKLAIIILILIFIGGMVFAFVSGNIKFPGINKSFSIVKKDPRSIILNTPNTVSKLKSYKMESTISVSSPAFSNITTGLASGEAVNSKDRESIDILVNGMANRVNNKLIFDNLVTLKSSILEDDIISNWKYDGNLLYISIPDLSKVVGNDAPLPTVVNLNPNQLGSMLSQLATPISDIIKKIDIYNIMSEGVPLYVKTEAISIIKEFINSTEYTEKGKETIHNINTYHYELTADRPSTKKFLNSLVNLFTMQMPPDQKQNLDEAIGASSINSFEVWVGENDDNLYQIKFTLNMPLSKVLGLNDSGIADNEVKLEWKTTYFDIDAENKIDMPNDTIDIKTFINRTKDIKIKNTIDSFRSQTTTFKNSMGSYGLRLNPAGSCTNPNPGSLFSPKGHKQSADAAIASISSSMNSLLSETNGLGSCYSTSSTWALAAPLFDNSDPSIQNYYCTDSSGNTTTLTNSITGPICK